jgi:hypothetical protein
MPLTEINSSESSEEITVLGSRPFVVHRQCQELTLQKEKGICGRFRHFSLIEAIKDYFQKLLNKKKGMLRGRHRPIQ